MADLQLAIVLDAETSFAAHGDEVIVLRLYADWKQLVVGRDTDEEIGQPVSMPIEVTRMRES